jgi:hypothetical protein
MPVYRHGPTEIRSDLHERTVGAGFTRTSAESHGSVLLGARPPQGGLLAAILKGPAPTAAQYKSEWKASSLKGLIRTQLEEGFAECARRLCRVHPRASPSLTT